MTAKITILGCGNSTGIPAVGNYWGNCDPNEPKNRRTRSSILVQTESTVIVVDTGPDIRTQINTANIDKLDAVLYSHHHGDHVNGIDDLRSFFLRQKKPVPIYGSIETFEDLQERFFYLFEGAGQGLYPPAVEPHIFKPEELGQNHKIGDIEFIPFLQDHGTCQSTGFRFGNITYSVDMWKLDENALEIIKGSDIWIVDGAGYFNADNPVHANIERIYEYNEIVGAKEVYLTSLALNMDYQTVLDELKNGYAPAYDGLKFSVVFG